MASQTAIKTHLDINNTSQVEGRYSDAFNSIATNNNHKAPTHETSITITRDTSETSITDVSTISLSALQTDLPITSNTDIKYKLIFLFLFIPAMLSSIYFLRHSESAKYKIIAMAMFWIFMIFYPLWLYFIFNSSKLHRIEVITAKLAPHYGNMIFPLQIKRYPFEPVFSMSELFAIRGSSVHLLFCVMCISIGSIVSLAITMHWVEQFQNGVDIVHDHEAGYWQFLAINGALATPIIGNFDLNPHSKGHIIMHYIGVTMMGLSVFPYGIQQNWSIESIILIASGLAVLAIWVILSYCFTNDLSDQVDNKNGADKVRAKVHRVSVFCIVMETIGCIIISAVNTLFIWDLKCAQVNA